MENCQKPVQNGNKKGSRREKVGRLKYNLQLLKKAQNDIEKIWLMEKHIIRVGLKGFFRETA